MSKNEAMPSIITADSILIVSNSRKISLISYIIFICFFVFPLLVNVIRNTISILKNENIFEGFNETKFKKSLAMFIGYRAKEPNYGFAIEKTEGGKKKINIAFHNAETAEFCSSKNTWVTPGIPYMLLITGGFIIQLIYGDILMNFFGIGA